MRRTITTTLVALALLPLPALGEAGAGDSELAAALVRAVRKQNAEGLSAEEIAERDERWQAEEDDSQFKWTLQQTRAGRYLRDRVDRDPAYNEAFLTDGTGANVAAYPPTSDYFQGDEEKWSASFNDGAGEIFLGPLEYDDSTGV